MSTLRVGFPTLIERVGHRIAVFARGGEHQIRDAFAKLR